MNTVVHEPIIKNINPNWVFMPFYTDEFLSAKSGVFEKKEFNISADQSLETEVSESLNSFGIKGQVVGSEAGPCITRIYFKLDRGVRFSSIEPLTDDLKMSLGTPSIKIMPDPERGAVAIEIPNAKRENIPFGNVFCASHSDMALPAALGVDPKGNPIYLDIADTPHLLIAGTTGSGKSVCLNSIITSLALNCRPTDLQFLLIDPKGTEFVQYEGVKNLISGRLIDDVETALMSLAWLVEEMEWRYKILKRCKCRSINEYKQKRNFGLNDGTSTLFFEDMPYIVVVIDEYADLMMNSAHALQEDVKRLGQKARAAGIHLVLATQRPSTKIIDGDIKTNFPTRIALKVSSITDSKTILDYGGAERLLGKGDMLLKRQGEEDPQRVHGCFISNDEIEKANEMLPQKKLYRINEEDVFENDIHNLHTLEVLKKYATWGELNAVSKIALEKFGDFMDGNRDTIYQKCANRLGMDESRVEVVFKDITNAIGEPDFFRMLLQSCSEGGKSCDFPFVKAVIYSSPLRWKYKDGRYLFTDYILEQAFEKEDSAAMASVRFFCNIETFHLDYLKKKIDKLCENGNEKVKEYLVELKDKVVDNLKNEYCGDIEEYPNRELFDRLIAEAYPSLMNFLLESGNEQYFIDAAENNSLIVDFIAEQAWINESWEHFVFEGLNDFKEKCVQRMVEKGNDDAIECICNRDQDYLSDSVREFIFQLAVKDKDVAIETVAEYSGHYDLCNRFNELSEYGQSKALDVVCQEIEEYGSDSSGSQIGIVFEMAKKGNERACECIDYNYDVFEDCVIRFIDSQNFADVKEFAERINLLSRVDCRIDTYAHFVCALADEGVDDAENMIYCDEDYVDNYVFQQYVVEKADNADKKAWSLIKTHHHRDEFPRYFNYLKDNVSSWKENIRSLAIETICDCWYDFQEVVLELACDGNESAKDAIYNALDSSVEDEFCEFVLKDAQEGNAKSQKVIYDNPYIQLFQQYILDEAKLGNDDAIEVIYSHPEVGDFRDFALLRAKADDCDAKKIVLTNVEYELFQNYIVELALQGDAKAKKVVLDNPEIALFQECICKLVSSNEEESKVVVLANVKYDLFQKCICELALQGDAEAKKVVLDNSEIALFQECICKLVLKGDCDAEIVVRGKYKKSEIFQKCIVDSAQQGNEIFTNLIYENVKSLSQKVGVTHVTQETIDEPSMLVEINNMVKKYELTPAEERQLISMIKSDENGPLLEKHPKLQLLALWEKRQKLQAYALIILRNRSLAKLFRGFVVSEARQNKKRALECIETDPQDEEYKSFLIEKCFELDEWALSVVSSNISYYKHWINKTIASQCNKKLIELLTERISSLAKFDENALKYVVCENPQVEKFKDLIAEKSRQNRDVVEYIFKYYLRKVPSPGCFSEFVRQKISKEFGIHFEEDDDVLRNKIEDLRSDDNKYFVLAKAWGGNELALAAFRKGFLGFSRIITDCLRNDNPEIWKYMMDCVNSDTTGKIIKELVEKGNRAAGSIVLLCRQRLQTNSF